MIARVLSMLVVAFGITLFYAPSSLGGEHANMPSPTYIAATTDSASLLVKKSPWSGKWSNRRVRGTMELIFFRNGNGQLRARLQNVTGAPFPVDGEVTGLTVSGNSVRFTSRTSARYKLKLSGNTLKGDSEFDTSTSTMYSRIDLTSTVP